MMTRRSHRLAAVGKGDAGAEWWRAATGPAQPRLGRGTVRCRSGPPAVPGPWCGLLLLLGFFHYWKM